MKDQLEGDPRNAPRTFIEAIKEIPATTVGVLTCGVLGIAVAAAGHPEWTNIATAGILPTATIGTIIDIVNHPSN